MRVARISFEFYPQKGGSITNMIELASKLSKKQIEHVIIVPKREGFHVPSFLTEVEVSPVDTLAVDKPIVPILLRILLFIIPTIDRLKKLDEKGRIDIVHVNGFYLGAMLSLLLRLSRYRWPMIITRDGGLGDKTSSRHTLNEYLALIFLLFSRAEIFLVDDGTDIDSGINFLKKARLRYSIVRTAIDSQKCIAKDYSKSSDDRVKVVTTHRLIAFKNIRDTILAFGRASKECNDVPAELIIIGSGDQEQELKRLVTDSKIEHITFVGEMEHQRITEILPECDLFIATSRFSNVNLSTMEAMAAGLPVIAYSSGRTRSLVENGKNGLLIETGDIDELAHAMCTLMRDPKRREQLGRRARETIVEQRSWNAVVESYYQAYSRSIRA